MNSVNAKTSWKYTWTIQVQREKILDEILHNTPPHVSASNIWKTLHFLFISPCTNSTHVEKKRHHSKQATPLFRYVPSDLSDWLLFMDWTCLSFQTVSHKRCWLWSDMGFYSLLLHPQLLNRCFHLWSEISQVVVQKNYLHLIPCPGSSFKFVFKVFT